MVGEKTLSLKYPPNDIVDYVFSKISNTFGSVAKTSTKYVNLYVINKNQNIQGKCTNIIKLYQIID